MPATKPKPPVARALAPGQRRAEIAIAALFLITAATSIYGVTVLDPILKAPDYLARVYPAKGAIAWGALLWSINNIGVVFIAVFAYPLLRRLDETAAIGYLTARILEGAIMMVGIAATLMLIPLSQSYIARPAPELAAVGDLLQHLKLQGLTTLSLPLLGLGGLIFVGQLHRFRLVPRAISAIGLLGYALVLTGGVASWFDLLDASPLGPSTFMAIPVALFEIILLPTWLLAKGLNIPKAA
ncbi:DUF4386 domain-containing protein [Phenylobacterium aquaticum]|uniref:DUF4386 domain-containing protein n=1 Tax=Phenylobacterium aquaticum TaxID=1763816 RepID=UPI001F5D7FAC|nr:DUF4386 domain-containing protein [Phenylobacterium aquaticum]MCI3135292.1 DUF4386 domain-containing protein [Phenylobacterium aquaticum]